jgi:hypothetical protein
MTRRWTNFLLLAALFVFALPTAAQTGDPPPLRAVATDDIGRLALFYPEDWVLAVNDDGSFGVRDEESQIAVSVRLVEHNPLAFDDLPQALIEAGELPDDGTLSQEVYSEMDSWLVQGNGIFQNDLYSAVAALPVASDQTYIIRNDFPADRLGESAALVTAMLDKLVILPASVRSEGNNLSLQVPLGWQVGNGIDSFLAAPTAEDLRAISRNEVPRQMGISIRFVIDTSLEDQLSSQTALAQTTSTFQMNGVLVTLVLRQDNTRDAVEIGLIRPRGADTFLTMRAVSSDADVLVENVALLQAIFASVRLQ